MIFRAPRGLRDPGSRRFFIRDLVGRRRSQFIRSYAPLQSGNDVTDLPNYYAPQFRLGILHRREARIFKWIS